MVDLVNLPSNSKKKNFGEYLKELLGADSPAQPSPGDIRRDGHVFRHVERRFVQWLIYSGSLGFTH